MKVREASGSPRRASSQRMFLNGDQAVAWGAVEAGVHVVTGYPGTPSTKAIEILAPMARELGIWVEWSVNEKVALEVATGAAWAGQRALATMKMSGLNVAADSLLSIAHSGTIGGLVIYAVDDINAYYGMVEQDSRYYALLSSLPMLEPSDPQEAKDMARLAFELSEDTGAPVLLRSTTHVANALADVAVSERSSLRREARFTRDIARFTKPVPEWCVAQHADALRRLGEAGRRLDYLNLLTLVDHNPWGVVASGVSWQYLCEVMTHFELTLSTLKVATANPLPVGKLSAMLHHVDRLLILEELEPIVEERARALLAGMGRPVTVLGKEDGTTPRVGDFSVEIVAKALGQLVGKELETVPDREFLAAAEALSLRRPLEFCAGCPHRATYYALNQALRQLGYGPDQAITTGDIGCTIIGINKPFETCWTEVAMGASIGLAQGFQQAGITKPVVATIGDGTFYHAGIPALLNAVQAGANIAVIILDNQQTAMTGHQPNPGTGLTARGERTKRVDVAALARACGVRSVAVVDPYSVSRMVGAIVKAIQHPGVAVVIARRQCPPRGRQLRLPVRIAHRRCPDDGSCQRNCFYGVGCPAIALLDGRAHLNIAECSGCGLCVIACPQRAIRPDYSPAKLWQVARNRLGRDGARR